MSSIVQPSLLGRINERQILRTIQQMGPLSRADLARSGGISAPTASKAVESLLRAGLLEEADCSESQRGRPAKLLRLPNRSAQVLGLVVDAGRCHLVAAGLDGRTVHDDGAFATAGTYEELVDEVCRRVLELRRRSQMSYLGLGLCMPGLIDHRRHTGLLSPNLPLTNDRPLADDLAARLNLPCVMLQESHALCLAELRYGAARGLTDFAMMDLGVGIGLGVMSGGRLLTGVGGFAGEVGHITLAPDGVLCGCGNVGCFETVASVSALERAVSSRLGRLVTLDEMLVMDAEVLSEARAEMLGVARYAGIGVAAVINLFNPSTLFIHSRMFDVPGDLFSEMCREAERRSLRPSFLDCRIVKARGSKRQGAVAGIIEHLISRVVPASMDSASIPGFSPWSGTVAAARAK
jgi:N-acetylglucosamine repressor